MSSELSKFFKSFYYAFEGVKTGLTQRNCRIHFIAAISIISVSFILNISPLEWLAVIIMIAAVISAELINSSIEEICNILNKHHKLDYYDTWNPRNLAAGAVFVLATSSVIVAAIIFVPKLIALTNY